MFVRHKPCQPAVAALAGLGILLAAGFTARAENLIPNGSFDHAKDPLHGWITDYAWTGNKFYIGNKDHISVRNGVAEINSPGDQGAKLESIPIPFEPGFRYQAEFKVKGGPYRVYFAGYRWKPGVRPHDKPELGELRLAYKSKALAEESRSWTSRKIELPGVTLSPQAKSSLKQVRFITLYVWMMKSGSLDEVTITRTPDPEMAF